MTTAPENRLSLSARVAADLMAEGLASLPATTTFREAVSFFIDHNTSVALVTADSKPVGVITLTDLLIHVRECLATERISSVPISSLMTETIFSVPSSMPVDEVVQDMLRSKVHHLFVQDHGKIVGVINACDFVQHLRTGD